MLERADSCGPDSIKIEFGEYAFSIFLSASERKETVALLGQTAAAAQSNFHIWELLRLNSSHIQFAQIDKLKKKSTFLFSTFFVCPPKEIKEERWNNSREIVIGRNSLSKSVRCVFPLHIGKKAAFTCKVGSLKSSWLFSHTKLKATLENETIPLPKS